MSKSGESKVKNPVVRKLYCYVTQNTFSKLMTILWKNKGEGVKKPNLGAFLQDLIESYIKEHEGNTDDRN